MKKSKKKKKSNTWKIKQHRDQFFRKSKTLGFRSRSAFKLIELNKKFNFIKKNTNLLDIGSYPGGWSQVAKKIISSGKILSIDLKKMDEIKKVNFLQGDFLKDKEKIQISEFFKGNLDVILSDMAADTTGNKSLDCIRTNQLCSEVIEFSHKNLKKKRSFNIKIIHGRGLSSSKRVSKIKIL